MSDDFDWVEREKGILNERDRRYLLGELNDELSDNAKNVRRHKIRERLENAIYDFSLLARGLPYKDIRQVFDPVDDWSRERRRLDIQNRESTSPDVSPFIQSWVELFEFFTISMYANGMPESRELMNGIIESGIERGYRNYQRHTLGDYREVDVGLTIQTSEPITWESYIRQIADDLPDNASDSYAQIRDLYRRKYITYGHAQWLIDNFVNTEVSLD